MKCSGSVPLIYVRLAAVFALASAVINAQSPPTMVPPIRGIHEMVGAANNFEVEAGYRLLTEGGNAVDAGVASVLAASVTELSRFGLGGEMPLLIKMAGRAPIAISGIGVAPRKATLEFYANRSPEPWEDANNKPPIPVQGILSAITPGVFDGLILALENYGTKSFADVAAPAIQYSEEGFPMPEEFGGMLQGYQHILSLWPASTSFFYPNGTPTPRGQIFREPIYANTLKELVAAEKKARGKRAEKLRAVRDLFYQGSIAKRIAEFSEKNGGLIEYQDLAHFHADSDQPRMGTYRGYEIYKPGFWTQGPVMIETLNLLEGFDLKGMGHNSPQYLHTVLEAVKLAFADRDQYYGDPKFSKIPAEQLLSKEYAAERRKLIGPDASLEFRPGKIGDHPPQHPYYSEIARRPIDDVLLAKDTTCVDAIDKDGMAFSATPSGAWMPTYIAGDTGIALTQRAQSFLLVPGHPNELAPGKRPRVTLSPTLVVNPDKTVIALSTPGGDNQDQSLLQVLFYAIFFGMNAEFSVEAPRFQTEHLVSSFDNHAMSPGSLLLDERTAPAVVTELQKRHHVIEMRTRYASGAAPVIVRLTPFGLIEAGADPFYFRAAQAW